MIRPLLWLPLLALSFAPALAQEASLEKRVQKLHALAGGEWCQPPDEYWAEDAFESWTFTYQPAWSADAEEETVTLVRMFCMAGAYNISHAFYWERSFEGLMPLSLAMPAFRSEYENDDSLEGELLGLTVTGMGATTLLVNSEFDPETLMLSSNSLWRGIGDASSNGIWVFLDGEFVLKSYAIDASYDGEVNPEVVVDYSTEE